MDKYYTSKEYLLDVYEQSGHNYVFKADNISQYRLWKKEFWGKLADLIGLKKMDFTELKPEIQDIEKLESFTRTKVLIETEPDVLMPFYILVPADLEKDEKRAAVIAIHGHGSGGKEAVAGKTEIPLIREAINKYNYDYGVQLVKKGYIVFCPDARGFGERREKTSQGEEKLLDSSCNDLNNVAISLGQTLTGMFVWDLIRLIDFIEKYNSVDPDKIGVCGFSGGGLQALWIAIMDERIKAAIVANYFHGYKDTIFQSNMCGCNFVPGLWELCDMGDLAAMIAPRALMIKSGSKDRLNGASGLDNVYSQIEITKKAYKLFKAEEKLNHHIFSGGHQWNGEKVAEFLKKHL